MDYPSLSESLQKRRHNRALRTLRPGDIIEGWLDCTPSAGKRARPLPMVVLGFSEEMYGTMVMVKTLFSSESWTVNLTYKWRKVGHIDGFDPAE